MRILVSFYSKTDRTKTVAEEIAKALRPKNHEVVLHELAPKEVMKAAKYNKEGKGLELIEPLLDVKDFDLVFVGTPVWSFCPSPIVLSYLRQLKNTKKKKFAVFSTCSALPGTTIKRMSSILATKSAEVVDFLPVKSLFELDDKGLNEVRKFAEKVEALI